jgi:mycofactocin system creatininase family protein
VSSALADLSWPQIDRLEPGCVLAVPIGATEQHGPHLPISTDTDIAVGLAEALARERPGVLVAPALTYGSSGEHDGFPGTLSIGRDAVAAVLIELGRSASASFARTVLVCAHGGNNEPLRRAERQLRTEGRDVRAFFPNWPGDAHAGRIETSLMLALAPARVRLELAAAGVVAPLSEILPALIASGVREVSRNGVLGDPQGASVEEGRALLRRALEQLTELLDRWEA